MATITIMATIIITITMTTAIIITPMIVVLIILTIIVLIPIQMTIPIQTATVLAVHENDTIQTFLINFGEGVAQGISNSKKAKAVRCCKKNYV